ncbi:MAG: FadR family transcriptional regulator [Treponema sp.]|jgi:GntR family transcriptional repressor for pyruvate dehydrogenase complex|nr:FadR family transcriptional regulator [Treponema sp.]
MLKPIKTEKLYNVIMRRITEFIREQKLESGDKLPPERELAIALSVSRASVRQAITALAAQGIVTMRHGDGNYISQTSENGMLELFGHFLAGAQINPDEILEVRLMLECEAARLCALRADDKHLSALRNLLERNRIQNGQEDSLSNMNKDLHSAIAEGAANSALLRIMDAVWDIMGGNMWPLLKNESNNRKRQIELHLDQHEQIVEAICARDEKKAYQEMYKHLVTIEREMDSIVKKPFVQVEA